jgi:hypothetical protein
MTDEAEAQEHVCYGVLRMVTPLPIEEQQALRDSPGPLSGNHTHASGHESGRNPYPRC